MPTFSGRDRVPEGGERAADGLSALRVAAGDRAASRVRPPRWIAYVLGVALLIAFGIWVSKKGLVARSVEAVPVSLARSTAAATVLTATGFVASRHDANVAPRISGRLVALRVKEGDRVEEGQILAELDHEDPAARLAEVEAAARSAQAAVARASAELRKARLELGRQQRLFDQSLIARSALDDALAAQEVAAAQLAAAKAEARAAEARLRIADLDYQSTFIRAPFGGTVVKKGADLGEVLAPFATGTPGSVGAMRIADLSALEVEAEISETQVQKVKPGMPAEIVLDAMPDRPLPGVVGEIRPAVDRSKATVIAKVRFDGEPPGVLPDMAARVNLLSHPFSAEELQARPVSVLPREALATRNGRTVVFAIQEGRAVEVGVKVGEPLGEQLRLLEGPPEGTRLVRNPSPRLRNGVRVKVKSS